MTLFKRANLAFRKCNYDEAMALYTQALKENPELDFLISRNINRILKIKGLDNLATSSHERNSLHNYDGHIDQANRTVIKGWAVNIENSAEPVSLEIYLDDVYYAEISTFSTRRDLYQKYPSKDCAYGFSFSIQPTGQIHRYKKLSVFTKHKSYELRNSPITLCLGSPGELISSRTEDEIKNDINAFLLSPPSRLSRDSGIFISIIILTLNGGDLLNSLFKSFIEHNTYNNFEIIIVDHGSSDRTQDVCNLWKESLPICLLSRGKNYSYSESNNFGVMKSRGEHILFLNNDILIQTDILGQLSHILHSDSSIGIVGIRLKSMENYYSSSQDQHLGVRFATDYHDRPFLPYEISYTNPMVSVDKSLVEVPAVTAACMMMRRSDFIRIGGFHEAYYYGYEDVDLCLTSQLLLHKKNICALYLTAIHYQSATIKGVDKNSELWLKRTNNKAILAKRHSLVLQDILRIERIENKHFIRSNYNHVALLVSELADTTTAGDYFTALELARALSKYNGWDCYLVPKDDWYDLQTFDIVIALVDGFRVSMIKTLGPHTKLIYWIRNWFDRFLERDELNEFDQIWVSSVKALNAFRAKFPLDVKLLRIATNTERFYTLPPQEKYQCDYCFTGSYFGSKRQIAENLDPAMINFRFNLYGYGWEAFAHLAPYLRGGIPYSEMPLIYASTKIVIDDANHTTINWGSANSRVFDAIASGCLVITNSKDTSDDSFYGLLPVYTDAYSLAEMINHYLNNEDERLSLCNKLRSIVRAYHTYSCRATSAKTFIHQIFKKNTIGIVNSLSNGNNKELITHLCRYLCVSKANVHSVESSSVLHSARLVGSEVLLVLTDDDKAQYKSPINSHPLKVLIYRGNKPIDKIDRSVDWDLVIGLDAKSPAEDQSIYPLQRFHVRSQQLAFNDMLLESLPSIWDRIQSILTIKRKVSIPVTTLNPLQV